MHEHSNVKGPGWQVPADIQPLPTLKDAPIFAEALRQQLASFLSPLLAQLDARIDARLVRTFLSTIEAVVRFRHRAHGLLLSELGGFLLPPHQAPAGTKRLSNLLRSNKWTSVLLRRFLWQQAQARRAELEEQGEDVLVVWDESVVEKPESQKAEGLCAVRSRKAARLKRIKPGFYHPPSGRPVFVPGMEWVCLLLMGTSGPPILALMHWFSTRGQQATDARSVQTAIWQQCRKWGRRVIHIWDRGYAGTPWLSVIWQHSQRMARFILRWPKHYHLQDPQGAVRAAWQITRGKRSWDERWLRDTRRNTLRKVGVYATPVKHPNFDTPLWLVVARPGKGQEPWYLLTTERVETAEEAWRIVLAYARRWQIEMAFRFSKSELAMESPRLWEWERRVKLLLMVTLAYAFLLQLLNQTLEWLTKWLLRYFCHRTGKRSRQTATPLYRLRSALSRLWTAFPAAQLQPAAQNSA